MIYNPTVSPDTCPKCERPVAPDDAYCECGHPLKRVPDATAHAARADDVPGGGDGATREAHADQLGPGHGGVSPGALLFGRFRVQEELGRGGMGVVYKATDEQLNNRVVAVKVLAAHLATNAGAVARLKQEVIAAQGLQYPGIIRINTFHEGQGQVGFDMEHLDGATLAEHLSGDVPGSPFAPPATIDRLPFVASIVEQIAEALDFIHEKKLVHRDIKPSNLMLNPRADGGFEVKLLDFGIVHVEGGDLTGVAQPGTLSHMAPELIDGTGASPASDLFALGKVVYLALTGEPAKFAFQSDPPSSKVAGLPSTVDDPILSCMAARPDRRPQTAAALAEVTRAAADEVEAAARQEVSRLAVERERREAEAQARRDAEEQAEQDRQAEEQARREAAVEIERDPQPGSFRVSEARGILMIGLVIAVIVFGAVMIVVVGRKVVDADETPPDLLAQTTPGEVTPTPGHAPQEPQTPEPSTPEPVAESPNPAVIDWVLIPGGEFAMGSTDGWDNEKPVHDVTVASFEMSRTEVTVAQYRTCVDAGECTTPNTDSDYCNWGQQDRDDHPVNCVDWPQARSFASWAGGRLPSESEWEYAARGGESHEYAGSSSLDTVACWNRRESRLGTCPVKSKRANGYELYDMSGSVWEWVEDCGEDSYSGAPTDGSARTSCSGSSRVIRGGSWWDSAPGVLGVAYRYWRKPFWSYDFLGFRLARDVP